MTSNVVRKNDEINNKYFLILKQYLTSIKDNINLYREIDSKIFKIITYLPSIENKNLNFIKNNINIEFGEKILKYSEFIRDKNKINNLLSSLLIDYKNEPESFSKNDIIIKTYDILNEMKFIYPKFK